MAIPTIQARFQVPFPAAVTGVGGIGVSKANGIWTIQPNFGALDLLSQSQIPNATVKQAWIYDSGTGVYNRVSMQTLANMSVGVGSFVPITGGTMTGPLVLPANPTTNLQAAPKQYVDAGDATVTTNFQNADTNLQTQVNAKVTKAGDTLTGPLVLAADPASALQAATKQYVDAGDAGKLSDAPLDGQLYGRQSGAWSVVPAGGGGGGETISISDTPPTGVPVGSLWWDSSSGLLWILYNDGDSTQWVSAVPMTDPSTLVQKAGDTMTGALVLSGDPTAPLQAATKNYVDAHGGGPPPTIALSGDVAGSGTTAIATILATVNSNVGTFQGLTVNAKGLVTAAVGQGYLTGNQNITITGDVAGSGTTAITGTLATVNANVGTFQGITVNGKGLVTAAANQNYLTGNQTITLSGAVTGSGTTSIVTALASAIVTFVNMAASAIATTAQYLANTTQKILSTDQIWAAAVPVTITDAATVTPDFSLGINFFVGLSVAGATRTLANPINVKAGQSGTIFLQQDATGNRTVTWGSNYKFPGATKPTLSTGAGAIDVVSYCAYSSTIIACSFGGGMA
jgi:hypothetical protein